MGSLVLLDHLVEMVGMAPQALWVHLGYQGPGEWLVPVETQGVGLHTCAGGGLLVQQVLNWCTQDGLLGRVTMRKEARVTHCVYQWTLNTGHTLLTHGQLSCTEWSMNLAAMLFHVIWIKLTCRVPCATCPPGLLCLCNQRSTPVPLAGMRSTTGTSSVTLNAALGGDARTPFVWT